MYKKGTGNDKQGKDAGNRTLCLYRNFSQAINPLITWPTHTDRVSRNLIGLKPVCKSPYSPGKFYTSTGCPAPMFAESVYRVNTTNKLKLNNVVLGRRCRGITEFRPKNQLCLKNEEDV